MIHYIRGTVQEAIEHTLVIAVGPIGLTFSIPNTALVQVGQEITLHTYIHWNQEQGPSLYGFLSSLERTMFMLIITCSGIGPKIGLAVLAHMSPEQCMHAIETGDEQVLSKVPGIGAKKAEQIIVQLKHKVHNLIKSGAITIKESTNHWHTVTQALESLNYSRTEINYALNHIKKICADEQSFDSVLRQALSFLAKQVRT